MAIETLDKVKNLFSKVTGVHKEDNSYREQAHVELLGILKDIIDNDIERKEMFNWFRTHGEKDKMFVNFLKQEILKITGSIVKNPMNKDDLWNMLNMAVSAEILDNGDEDEAYENLVECVECFVDSGDFDTLQDMLAEIGEKAKAGGEEEDLNIHRSDMLVEVVFYVLSNIYRSDVEDGKDIIKSSTIFMMPMMLRAKNSIIETPNINKLSEIIKKSLVKRGVISNPDNIEVGTSLYNANDVDNLSFENLWTLHNSILFDYDTGPDNELRTTVQQYNGEASLVFCFLTVLTNTDASSIDGINERVQILDSLHASFEDVSLWNDIGKQLENVSTTYKVYPPQDCLDMMASVDSYKEMTKVRVIISRQEKGFDVVYSNIDNSDDILLMFIDSSTGLLNLSYQLSPDERINEVLLELAEVCEESNINFYKYKHILSDKDLAMFNDSLTKESMIDAFKYIKNSVTVDGEWKGWLNIDSVQGNKTLH